MSKETYSYLTIKIWEDKSKRLIVVPIHAYVMVPGSTIIKFPCTADELVAAIEQTLPNCKYTSWLPSILYDKFVFTRLCKEFGVKTWGGMLRKKKMIKLEIHATKYRILGWRPDGYCYSMCTDSAIDYPIETPIQQVAEGILEMLNTVERHK